MFVSVVKKQLRAKWIYMIALPLLMMALAVVVFVTIGRVMVTPLAFMLIASSHSFLSYVKGEFGSDMNDAPGISVPQFMASIASAALCFVVYRRFGEASTDLGMMLSVMESSTVGMAVALSGIAYNHNEFVKKLRGGEVDEGAYVE